MNNAQRARAVDIGTKLFFGAVAIALVSVIVIHDSRHDPGALYFFPVFLTPVMMLVPPIYILLQGRIAFRKKLLWLLLLAILDYAGLNAMVVSLAMIKSAQIVPWSCVAGLAPGYIGMYFYRKRVVMGTTT